MYRNNTQGFITGRPLVSCTLCINMYMHGLSLLTITTVRTTSRRLWIVFLLTLCVILINILLKRLCKIFIRKIFRLKIENYLDFHKLCNSKQTPIGFFKKKTSFLRNEEKTGYQEIYICLPGNRFICLLTKWVKIQYLS